MLCYTWYGTGTVVNAISSIELGRIPKFPTLKRLLCLSGAFDKDEGGGAKTRGKTSGAIQLEQLARK